MTTTKFIMKFYRGTSIMTTKLFLPQGSAGIVEPKLAAYCFVLLQTAITSLCLFTRQTASIPSLKMERIPDEVDSVPRQNKDVEDRSRKDWERH